MWSWNRRNLLPVNYAEEDSEEENYQSPDKSPSELLSPRRPRQAGSPVQEDLTSDARTDRTLAEVNYKLATTPRYIPDPNNSGLVDEEVVEQLIVQEAQNEEVEQEPDIPPPPPIMAAFEDENGADDEKALSNALRLLTNFQFKYNDVDFYFTQIETKMQSSGVKKQFTKFQVLGAIIPEKVQDQVKAYLRKKETEWPENNSYKKLKEKILKIFGPTQSAGIERALGRTLVGTPSELARAIADDICRHELDGCCCDSIVLGIWKKNLPLSVRQAVAHMKFNKDTFENVVQIADDVYASSRPSGVTVAAATVQPSWTMADNPSSQELQSTAFIADPSDPIQVATQNILAAVQRGGFRGRGGGRGGRG